MRWAQQLLHHSLVTPVERDHRQSDAEFRRRRVVAGGTLLVGAVLLALSLATEPGDPRFILLTFLLALTWVVGAFLSGPLHAGWIQAGSGLRRPVLQPLAIGLAAVAVFCVGAVLVAQVPALRSSVDSVLDHARFGTLPLIVLITLLNGLAEELFFRGALYAAIGVRHPVAISTAIYGLTTVATLNVMLVFAAVVLGLLVGAQRRASGGVLAPMITHVTWALGMLFVLPPLMSALT